MLNEKSCITRALAPYGRLLKTFAHIYTMRRLTKISCAGTNYEYIHTLSDSFISTSDPTGSEHQRIYSSLRKTELVSLCFHVRIQRGSRGSKSPGKLQCWGLKIKSCFLTDGPGPPPPPPLGKNSWIRA